MRNDVNKRPKRPGDLAALLASTPPEDQEFLQGVVLTMTLSTGANSVELAGGLVQTNCVVIGDPGLVPAGTPVFLVRVRRRYFILGPMVTTASGELYRFSQTLVYTAGTSFLKASYPGLRAVRVRVVGGGGGGAGAGATGAGQWSFGDGGGGGEYAEGFFLAAALAGSTTITIGTAGSAGVGAANGGNGGTTSFGALITALGGGGGAFRVATNSLNFSGSTGARAGGSGGTGGNIRIPGHAGGSGIGIGATSGTQQRGGDGGASHMSGTAVGGVPGGVNGSQYGGGGSGASRGASTAAANGGAGATGACFVDTYL